MMRRCALVVPVIASLFFTGCAKKEPLDYLPDCQAYLAFNMNQVDSQSGAKRLRAALAEIQPASSANQKVKNIYLGLSGIGPNMSVYGVMVGDTGFPETVIAEAKSKGGTEVTIDGKKGVTIQQATMLPISDTGVLMATRETDFDTMTRTANKKNPSAQGTPLFTKLQQMQSSHAASLVLNAGPLVTMAEPQLNMLAMINPKGVAAIKQVQTATAALDWDEQPRLQSNLLLGDEAARKDLVDMLQMGLQQVMSQPQAMQQVAFLKETKIDAGTDAVELKMDFPKAQADEVLANLEKTVAGLPKDPALREEAFKNAMLSGMYGAGPGAPGAMPPDASQPMPGMQPGQMPGQIPMGTPGQISGTPGQLQMGTPGQMPMQQTPSAIPQTTPATTP